MVTVHRVQLSVKVAMIFFFYFSLNTWAITISIFKFFLHSVTVTEILAVEYTPVKSFGVHGFKEEVQHLE